MLGYFGQCNPVYIRNTILVFPHHHLWDKEHNQWKYLGLVITNQILRTWLMKFFNLFNSSLNVSVEWLALSICPSDSSWTKCFFFQNALFGTTNNKFLTQNSKTYVNIIRSYVSLEQSFFDIGIAKFGIPCDIRKNLRNVVIFQKG